MGPHTAMPMKQEYRKQQHGVVWASLHECVHWLMRWWQGGRREEMKQVRRVREDGRKGKLERKDAKDLGGLVIEGKGADVTGVKLQWEGLIYTLAMNKE